MRTCETYIFGSVFMMSIYTHFFQCKVVISALCTKQWNQNYRNAMDANCYGSVYIYSFFDNKKEK